MALIILGVTVLTAKLVKLADGSIQNRSFLLSNIRPNNTARLQTVNEPKARATVGGTEVTTPLELEEVCPTARPHMTRASPPLDNAKDYM